MRRKAFKKGLNHQQVSFIDYICIDGLQSSIIYDHANTDGLIFIRNDFIKICHQLKKKLLKLPSILQDNNPIAANDDPSWSKKSTFDDDEEIKVKDLSGDIYQSYYKNHSRIQSINKLCEIGYKRDIILNHKDKFSYWIIGRLYQPNIICFVCYQDTDNMPNEIITTAFNLCIGMDKT